MKRACLRTAILFVCLLLLGCTRSVAPTVLVLFGGAVPDTHSYYRNTVALLEGQGLDYRTGALDEDLEYSTGMQGHYAAVVVSDYSAYAALAPEKKDRLDGYCRAFDVGIFFVYVGSGSVLNDGEVRASAGRVLSAQRVNPDSPVLFLTRHGGTLDGALPWYGRALTVASGAGYEPLATVTDDGEEEPNILLDDGSFDGVRRVFHGHDFHRFWLHDLLYLDALQWLSPVDLGVLRDRWIGVDIDDVFQVNWDPDPAGRTVKIQAEDVEAMIHTQDRLSALMEGEFRFHLGFNSGWYQVNYGPPPYDDAAGDRALVENRDAFFWFDHLPLHQNATNHTADELISFMEISRAWAQEHDVLPWMTRYHLSPYHAGIYPIHTPLYEAWRQVWDARYTCTTAVSRGFEHLGIRVAPRQSCGIWSSQHSWNQVNRETLDASIRGGALFRTILENPVSLFMTHQSNYARDRIALYLFETLIDFFDQWTNLRFIAGPNDELIEAYFRLYPE